MRGKRRQVVFSKKCSVRSNPLASLLLIVSVLYPERTVVILETR